MDSAKLKFAILYVGTYVTRRQQMPVWPPLKLKRLYTKTRIRDYT